MRLWKLAEPISEATSKYGFLGWWTTYYDPMDYGNPDAVGFHDEDAFESDAGYPVAQMYKFGDGTVIYMYLRSVGDRVRPETIVLDKFGKYHKYASWTGSEFDRFHVEFGSYEDSITGAYRHKEFGPAEFSEFKKALLA